MEDSLMSSIPGGSGRVATNCPAFRSGSMYWLEGKTVCQKGRGGGSMVAAINTVADAKAMAKTRGRVFSTEVPRAGIRPIPFRMARAAYTERKGIVRTTYR